MPSLLRPQLLQTQLKVHIPSLLQQRNNSISLMVLYGISIASGIGLPAVRGRRPSGLAENPPRPSIPPILPGIACLTQTSTAHGGSRILPGLVITEKSCILIVFKLAITGNSYGF